jgi:hypothetical protein
MTYEAILQDAKKMYETGVETSLPSILAHRGTYLYKTVLECGITDEEDIKKIGDVFDLAVTLRECQIAYVSFCEFLHE